MLTKKQNDKLNTMTAKYLARMEATHKVDRSLLRSWAARYRIVMEQVIQKQCKR